MIARFALKTELDRKRAMALLERADLSSGLVWFLDEEKRTDAQNRRLWAMLRDISQQVVWYGEKMDAESWKHVFSASVEKQRAVPGIDGGFVVMGVSTRNKSKQWFSDMFAVMEAFGAERGVKFTTRDYWC